MADRDPLENPEPLIRRVYAYVAYRIGDGADAEDVTSATFERALRYRDTFDPKRGDPAPGCSGSPAAASASTTPSGRRPSRRARNERAGRAGTDSARGSTCGGRRCSAPRRELIALRYGADLTAKQIADVTG